MKTEVLKTITVGDLKKLLNRLEDDLEIVQEYEGTYRGLTVFLNHNNDGNTALFMGDPRSIFGNQGELSEVLITTESEMNNEDYNYSDYMFNEGFLQECETCDILSNDLQEINGEIFTGEPEVVSVCPDCLNKGWRE